MQHHKPPPYHPTHCQPHNTSVIIRNPSSGLVLDGSQYEVTLQHFTGFPSQLWSIEPTGNGKYIIINTGNGKAMDIKGGIVSGEKVITYGRHGAENQQWFINSDNTIVSSSGNLALDINKGSLTAGNNIIAYPKHGGANQKFYIQSI